VPGGILRSQTQPAAFHAPGPSLADAAAADDPLGVLGGGGGWEVARMIASWKGLAVVAAIAVVLLVAVLADLARTPARLDRSLVPGFDPDRVTELVWERAGQPAVRVVRAGGAWQIHAPSSAPADPRAIGDVLAALRGARWHRAGDALPSRTTLTVVSGTARQVLGIAVPIAGTEQSWLVAGGRGLVVDSWVARALDPPPLALRIRTPLAEVRGARAIVIEGELAGDGARRVALRIEGRPRRLVRPAELLLAAEVAGELERALAELAIVRQPTSPIAVHGLAISLAGAPPGGSVITLEIGGDCPGAVELVAVAGTAGDGCIEPAGADAIERAVRRLAQPPETIVERRPVPFEPRRVVLADGAALETSPPQIGDRAANETRVAELLAVLAAPAEVAPRPSTPAAQHLTVTSRTGDTITLDLFAERRIARRGEPVALRPAPGAWTVLVRRSRELRDLGLWLEEPTTISALQIDRTRYQRGAVIGAWTREPPGPLDASAVEALVAALAAPRALGFADDAPSIAHRLTLSITPPVGAASERVLELGAPRATGCPARAGGEAFLLPAAICAQAAMLAR
jgi:hypothetical protein